jgi:nucleoside phosphorylase
MDCNRELTDAFRADNQLSARRWSPSQPRDRTDFEIAIICALPLEASAVGALFDKRWDDQTYSEALRDSNAYSTGVIGYHNVVLVHMPNMGKIDAATAAAGLQASFQGIQLALVVGICGGAPFGNRLSEDILLGDVVISKGLIQYDLGDNSLTIDLCVRIHF